ncbi:hypothetical protein DSCW_60250 [Desulfosarcina widdelii]|uniref:Radical SAM core domain-containing protein n=1 Tax=Desulfosarcina widdelii TaxID=947919 RepID=A0A5K7ZBX7_9BACT|nr:radical SAM protein [Desulfosarcina widdelii]BBO78608.1 hypothetical protein DSCW_60250 [Desulfosarcina widdelii]
MLDKVKVEEVPAVVALPDDLANPDHITIIKGSTDILLIAPHACIRDGKPKDDENTGPITEAVARQIGCSAIINTHYHKPDKKKYRKGHKPKIDEYPYGSEYDNLNLNVIAHAEQVPGYLGAIRDVVGEPGRPGKTTVIWIHGADDIKAKVVADAGTYDSPPAEIDAFIGYGQGDEPKTKTGGDRHTAEPETVERFRKALISNGMNAVPTDDNADNYRGRSEAGMNQWFRNEGYTFGQVESIQLEIRKGGFRDLHHNIEKTAGILIEALSQEILVPNNQKEIKADERLVEVAFTHLQGIFAKHIHEAMLHGGRYLVRTFYGSYKNARENNKIRKESLHQLIQKLSEVSGKAPKKTWIYDAVKLAVDDHHFRSTKFRLYGKIGHSHKVLLTRVPEITRKKRLVKEIAKANGVYTVEKLRQRIKETAKTNRVFITPENVPADATLEQQERKKLEELLGNLDQRIANRQNELVRYNADRERVDRIIKSKPKDKRKPRKVGFRDWTDPSCNVNIQTGCSNNCRYCYAKTQAYRREQVALGSWADQFIRRHDVDKHRNLYHGLVGFPSTHDITPKNLDEYLYVLGKLLRAGNEVLIVSKPRLKCIKEICDACRFFKDKILFRFTIGAMENDILRFWEPNAPAYEERKECLEYAYDKDFRTSLSMEPLLAMNQADQMIADLYFSVSEDIWIGPMNHLNEMKKDADTDLLAEIATIETGQTAEALRTLYDSYKGDPLIKWKTGARDLIKPDEM